MAHCPHCKLRVTRWWWFAKVFGSNEWTARCRGCGLTCAILVSKEFSRVAKFWALLACFGIYVGVFGAVYSTMKDGHGGSPNRFGLYIGLAGLAMLVFSLVAALVSDVRQSKVALTAAVVCHACGERLPDDFTAEACPVCGETL